MSEQTDKPRQLLSREQRQASILRAAASAFAEGGFASTSMDDVATAAGVTKLILYRHFESKEELYRAVLTEVATRLHDEVLRAGQSSEQERRGFATRSLLKVARENPDGFKLLVVHAAREPQFAEMHEQFHKGAFDLAHTLIGSLIVDPMIKSWASRTIVEYLQCGVIEWLEVGDAHRDEEFIELSTEGMVGLFVAWTGMSIDELAERASTSP